jgi:hypothetical protein
MLFVSARNNTSRFLDDLIVSRNSQEETTGCGKHADSGLTLCVWQRLME